MTRLEFNSLLELKRLFEAQPLTLDSHSNHPYYSSLMRGSDNYEHYVRMLDREHSAGRYDPRDYYASRYDVAVSNRSILAHLRSFNPRLQRTGPEEQTELAIPNTPDGDE
jgi:hypothetical protein